MSLWDPEALAATVGKAIGLALRPFRERLSAALERIAVLEARPSLEYRGVWTEGETYAAGACVTRDGSLWIAREATTDTPGEGATAWQLAVKRGKDGRDVAR